jgi:hypothetical protein
MNNLFLHFLRKQRTRKDDKIKMYIEQNRDAVLQLPPKPRPPRVDEAYPVLCTASAALQSEQGGLKDTAVAEWTTVYTLRRLAT